MAISRLTFLRKTRSLKTLRLLHFSIIFREIFRINFQNQFSDSIFRFKFKQLCRNFTLTPRYTTLLKRVLMSTWGCFSKENLQTIIWLSLSYLTRQELKVSKNKMIIRHSNLKTCSSFNCSWCLSRDVGKTYKIQEKVWIPYKQ